MPCLEISMPCLDIDIKRKLAARLTDVFVKIVQIEADIFGIVFHEYRNGQAAQGGKLFESDHDRPFLHMVLYCPKIGQSSKSKIIESFTNVFIECTAQPTWKPVVHICEHPYNNIGFDGKPLSEQYPELRERPFYYFLD